MQSRKLNVAAYWLITVALFALAFARLLLYTPTEASMGQVQKIFYLHLPVAISTFLACLVCFIASIAYLTKRDLWWDDLAAASARISVQLCTVVLLTGMIWGKSAWGRWWDWSPRLTFSLLLWALYIVYLTIRMSVESHHRRAVVSAVYAILAFLDVPLVWLSTRLLPDIHPASVQLAPEMKITLVAWFGPILLLSAGLIAMKFKLNQRQRLAETQVEDHKPAAAPLRWVGGAV
jgi:heme exporter protein C